MSRQRLDTGLGSSRAASRAIQAAVIQDQGPSRELPFGGLGSVGPLPERLRAQRALAFCTGASC